MWNQAKGLIYLLCAAICFMFPRYNVVFAESNTMDVEMFVEVASAQINQMRIQNGLAPISTAPLLQKMCGQRAEELATLYAHSRPNGSPWYTVLGEYGVDMNCMAGENIAAGYDTPESVVEGWMNSEGHRRNILNESYDYFAIGVCYKENDPDYYFYYWDLIFLSSENTFENEYIPDLSTVTHIATTTETTTEMTTTTETTTEATTTIEATTETTTMTTETTAIEDKINYGDCNLDGKVDLLDMILLQKYLSGQIALTRTQMTCANCNQVDGTIAVDDADAEALLQFVVILVDTLPIRAGS